MLYRLSIFTATSVDDLVGMDRSHPGIRNEIYTITVELVFRIFGDGFRVGVENVRSTLNDVDRDMLSADLWVLCGVSAAIRANAMNDRRSS